MRSLLTNQLKRLLHRLGYDLVRWQPRRQWPEELSRFAYQRLIHDFDIEPGARVLDIGSGAYPFPLATILTDRYFETTEHRSEKLIIDQRPFLISNCSQLPFATQSFDFVYCSHLLEHVENPIEICAELVRVGRRGYIETPTLAKDMLFSWAKGMHRWHVMAIGQRLIFLSTLHDNLRACARKSGHGQSLLHIIIQCRMCTTTIPIYSILYSLGVTASSVNASI